MINSSKKATGTTVLKPSEIQLVRRQLRNNNNSNQQQLNQLHILGIAGSMRQGSYGTQILKMVLEEAKKYNTDTQILDLRQVNLPLYDPENTTLLDNPSTSKENNNSNNNSNNLATISNALKWADSIILSSPDYHGSMSGAMKNFLDYFWEEFAGKTFG